MELSIIVTAYNVAPYIEECLESLLRQGLKDYEIIIVNDSSTDLTQPIIDRYVTKYEHIHSVISSGIGLGSARNYGLKFAKSDYIVFVGGDDYMKDGGLGLMLEQIKESDGDIVCCDIQHIEDDNPEAQSRIRKLSGDIKRDLILGDDRIVAKIFKRSFWQENAISFSSLLYEELPVALKTTVLANHIDFVDVAYYIDRHKDDRVMVNDKPFYIFLILEDIYSFFSTSGLLAEYHDELEYFYIEHVLIDGVEHLNEDESTYGDFMSQAFNMLREYFPRYAKNMYIDKLLTKKQRLSLRSYNNLTKDLWHRHLKKWSVEHY